MSEPAPRKLRILHYPTDTGGNPTGLSCAENRLGAQSTVAVTQRSPYRYDVDVDLDLGRCTKPGRLLGKLNFAMHHLFRHDVFHFNFGATLLPRMGPLGVDLPLLRALGKKIFMTYQGDDARLPEVMTNRQRNKRHADLAYAKQYCHRRFCVNPDLLRIVQDAEFVPYASVDPAAIPIVESDLQSPFTILHAPTNREAKGTASVINAIEKLRDIHEFEFLLIENLTHEQAMLQYRKADLVIDQLKIGWYGGFAVELMAMGKPVICYIREDDLRYVPPAMASDLPIIRAAESTLMEVLDSILTSRDQLAAIGKQCRAYVEKWHDPIDIARRMLAIYEKPSRPYWSSGEL